MAIPSSGSSLESDPECTAAARDCQQKKSHDSGRPSVSLHPVEHEALTTKPLTT